MRDLLRAIQSADPLALLALSQCADAQQGQAMTERICALHSVAPTAFSMAAHSTLFPPTPSHLCATPPLAGGRTDELSLSARLNAVVAQRIAARSVNM